jgi:hypothetical protein
MADRRRRERVDREARTIALVEKVMVAIGERDVAVAVAEERAGSALLQLRDAEGLSVRESVEWCGETLTVREATRLMRLVAEHADAVDSARSFERGSTHLELVSAQVEASGAATEGDGL